MNTNTDERRFALDLRSLKRGFSVLGGGGRPSRAGRCDRILVPSCLRFNLALAVGLGIGAATSLAAATQLVTSLGDRLSEGQTTLRQAISAAEDGDTIEFADGLFTGALPATLELESTLVLEGNLTINGPGDMPDSHLPMLRLMPKAGGTFRIMEIRPASTPGSAVISGLAFQGGIAAYGGAVLVASGSTAVIRGCNFSDNEATGASGGGAILNRGVLTLDRCLVDFNRAANGDGGGIASTGKLTILRSLFDSNVASGSGGGVSVTDADLWMEGSTIAGGMAGTGGGLAIVGKGRSSSVATLTAVTVVDNAAAAQAGGLYVEGSSAVANVGGSIFARNVVVNNSGFQSPHDLATQKSGKIDSADYNIVIKPGTTLSPNGPNDQIGVDPQLGSLAFNGGRTRTYAIAMSSPAWDRGNPSYPGILATDQRGFQRIWPDGGRADVGAFEFAPVLACAEDQYVEWTAPLTPAVVTASFYLPRGGSATVTWSVAGAPGSPELVSIPDDGRPVELTFAGDFAYGPTSVTVSVAVGDLSLTCSTTLHVVDTTPPVITLLGDEPVYVEYGNAFTDPGATATDSRDGAVAVAATSAVDVWTLGIYQITYSAVDAVGNEATASRYAWVRDTTPPVISTQPDIVAEATSATGAVVTFAPTATDAVGTPVVTTVPASGSMFPLGATSVTITAIDSSGNTATGTFTVTVADTTAPVIAAQPDLVVEATDAFGAVVTFTPTATDTVGTPVVTTSPVSGSTFPVGTTTVTVTAKDAANNTATSTFTVTVVDTTAPVIAAQPDLVVEATDAFGAVVTFAPTATDAVSTPVVTTSPASGSTFPVGTTTVTITAKDAANNTATGTFTVTVVDPYGITLPNVAWPFAIDLAMQSAGGNSLTGTFHQVLARAGESRWFKFVGTPGSRIDITLTNLPANFDLVVYSDIQQIYDQLLGLTAQSASDAEKKLALLGAEFAPEAYAPEAYSPEAYSPEAYAPEAYAPEAYAPEAYSPEAYAPEAYAPEAYAPEAYAPEAYAPEAYAPEAYAPEAYAPEAYASAQQRSLVGFAASPGTVSEGIRFTTYSKSGEFYVRIRGQNGVYSTEAPFFLTVTIQQDLCSGVTDFDTVPAGSNPVITGGPTSLFVWDSARIGGTSSEKTALANALSSFAAVADGVVIDVNDDLRIRTLNAQADANPYCPIAKNLVADAVRNLIQLYRTAAPTIADITLVGNDDVIPFFRTDDQALLASEANYFPPVREATQSQSSLRYAQVLSQDRYGSSCQIVLGTGPYDLPEIPVGRLVETAAEVKAYVDKYANLFNGTAGSDGVLPTPSSGLVAGYDFLADAAEAMKADFAAGLGAGATLDSLITPIDQPPAYGWTADQLRAAFLGSRHDITYLAAHFSTARALAADFTTRFHAREVASSTLDLAYALVLSAGCHSGYSTVDEDAIPLLTEQPDWAQAFARKQAIWIAGTGYQYGDTDFIEYTERLLLEAARALRTGTGPVSIGRAVVEAKRRYLADTAIMRGIHEKTLLQVTLYGLPMVKFNYPGARLDAPAPGGDVAFVSAVTSGPGSAQNLGAGELVFNPTLTRVDRTLDIVGSTDTITASYFNGSDGIVSIPGEPVRALESFNVSRPEGLVRGVGFRGGAYTDLGGFVPFTGAPATETRGVHGRFSTEVFYPTRLWNLNQIGELCEASGISELNTFPTQFLSDGPESATGTLRGFGQMHFTVFYCPETSAAALANPPAINVVASTVSEAGIEFAIETAATAGVGVQEVWVTYTGLPGSPYYGTWQSLTLDPPAGPTGIGTWTGLLPLAPGADPGMVRFIVQAVNGIGAVAQSTNFGREFIPGTSTLDGVGITGAVTTLTLEGTVPDSGYYRSGLPLQARLVDGSGQPVASKWIQFRLGSLTKSAVTNASGIASTTLILGVQPGTYTLEASFAGDATYQNASERRTFTVVKMPSQMTFEGAAIVPDSSGIEVSLKATDGTPLKERTVVFILQSGSSAAVFAEITDGAGRARLPGSNLAPGSYQVTATFALPVTMPDGSIVQLSDPLYGGCTAAQTVAVSTPLEFGDEQAWANYTDLTAPGATESDLGASKVEIFSTFASGDPAYGPNSIMSSAKAPKVTARVTAKLSGQTLATGLLSLKVQGANNDRWRGDAVINGTVVELNVDWDSSGGSGKYHVWIYPAIGSGPLYSADPALLTCELLLGMSAGEKPAGGCSEIGGAKSPWTQETGSSRVRSN